MGTSVNLTNPENPRKFHHESVRSWDYRESTIDEMVRLGVPFRCAEVAAIDFKGIVNTCYHNKLTPVQAARMLYDKATEVYQKDDGSWPYI